MSEQEDKIESTETVEQQQSKEVTKKSKKQMIIDETISWIKTIVFAVIFAIIITTFLIVNARVPSGSMENTVMTGDRLIANRLSYIFKEPERFDIVVFKFPDDESKLYIKRIIGLPGDTVEIRNNEIYINGSDVPLEDGFVKGQMDTNDAVYEVPEDSYFMMGDNRNNSSDSRYWNEKFVNEKKILGKAIFKYFPRLELLTDK